MDDLVDQTNYVVDASAEGIALLIFDKLATEFDLTPPVVEDLPAWEWQSAPPLGVLVREIAARLHPGEGVTGWLYSQQELAAYEAEQDRLAAQTDVT